jgi:hypothetical protein
VPHHLQSVPPGPTDEPPGLFGTDDDDAGAYEGDPGDFGGDAFAPIVRPAWWRWVAIAVIVAMIVAGPFAYVLSKLLT